MRHDVECGHKVSQIRPEVFLDSMTHMLGMTDIGEHGQNDLDLHPLIPFASFVVQRNTEFPSNYPSVVELSLLAGLSFVSPFSHRSIESIPMCL